MFVFRSDDGQLKVSEKGLFNFLFKKFVLEKVSVTALYYIEKSKLVVIGFNFGGVLSISLKTSKV